MSVERQLIHPRDDIMRTMQRIYRYRMTTTSGGNLSIRDDADDVWNTPARVDKGSLTRDDIVCARPDGMQEGLHPPSSEFPFHEAICEVRPDIRAVVHAHPVALVAFSICRQTPDTRLFHQANSVCAAMVRHLDDSVGEIMKTLADTGLAQNTLVVFSSDNGGVEYTNPPATDNYPFNVIVKHPDTGLPLTPHSAIRIGDHKLIWDWHGKLELYDIAKDPYEQNDLSQERPELTRQLFEKLATWLDANVERRYFAIPNPDYEAEDDGRTYAFRDLRKERLGLTTPPGLPDGEEHNVGRP